MITKPCSTDAAEPPRSSYFYIQHQEYAGHYVLFHGFIVSSFKRPSWWHRMMTRFFLGWTWVDQPTQRPLRNGSD